MITGSGKYKIQIIKQALDLTKELGSSKGVTDALGKLKEMREGVDNALAVLSEKERKFNESISSFEQTKKNLLSDYNSVKSKVDSDIQKYKTLFGELYQEKKELAEEFAHKEKDLKMREHEIESKAKEMYSVLESANLKEEALVKKEKVLESKARKLSEISGVINSVVSQLKNLGI